MMTDTTRLPSSAGSISFSRRAIIACAAATLALAPASLAMAKAPRVIEQDVMIATADGSADAVLFHPAKKGRWAAVILWPDLGGLRPVFRDMGRSLAAQGFVVLVPNSFYRSTRGGQSFNMADADVRAKVATYRAAATDDGIARDTHAYMTFLDAQPQTARNRKAAALGYDVGGSYAFRAAAAMPDRIGVVGSIHGLGVATPRPNSPHLLMPATTAAYYVAIAKDADAREPEDKDDIRKKLTEGGLEGVVEIYPANHGWAIVGNPAYNAAEAERAAQALAKLCKKKLR